MSLWPIMAGKNLCAIAARSRVTAQTGKSLDDMALRYKGRKGKRAFYWARSYVGKKAV